MSKDVYIYPAIFEHSEEGISIEFPDLPGCLPCAESLEQAIKNAKEALALHLYGLEEDGYEIPESSPLSSLKLSSDQILYLVEVYMPLYRDAIENSYVSKNVTLPLWLKKIAEDNKVNFSQLLQSALKEYLHITK